MSVPRPVSSVDRSGSTLPFVPLNQEALRERVVTAIRDAVIQGRLRPGEKVPEDELALRFGVSRTPVREAIRILEQQGMVKVLPKKGTYIATVDPADEADGLAVRAALEELAVRQALGRSTEAQWRTLCDRLDRVVERMRDAVDRDDLVAAVELDIEFHTALVRRSGNRYLSRTWHLVGMPFLIWSPERELYSQTRPSWTVGFADTHGDLVAAIRTRDETAATGAIREHIKRKVAQMSKVADADPASSAPGSNG
jgi:DNA-binding GntR family transcriptional regulator